MILMTTPEGNYKFRSFDRQTCANTVTTLCLAVAINLCGNIKPSTVDYGHHIGYFGVSMGLYTASIWNRGENRRVACKEIGLSYVWAGTRSIDGSIRAVSELPPLDIYTIHISCIPWLVKANLLATKIGHASSLIDSPPMRGAIPSNPIR